MAHCLEVKKRGRLWRWRSKIKLEARIVRVWAVPQLPVPAYIPLPPLQVPMFTLFLLLSIRLLNKYCPEWYPAPPSLPLSNFQYLLQLTTESEWKKLFYYKFYEPIMSKLKTLLVNYFNVESIIKQVKQYEFNFC